MQTSFHNLEKTGVTLEQLYSEQKQIRVHLTGNENVYTLVMIGRDKEPDFMLSSFTDNYFCRSLFGEKRLKYSSLKGVQKAVQRIVNSRIDNKCIVSFSISNEIDIF